MLEKIFKEQQPACDEENIPPTPFPAQHAVFLIRSHPSLHLEAFRWRTVVSFFLEAKVHKQTMNEIFTLYKQLVPASGPLPLSLCRYKEFSRQPNFVTDACLYGYGDGVLELILQEFPNQAMERDAIHEAIPIEFMIGAFLTQLEMWANNWNYELSTGVPTNSSIIQTVDIMLGFWPQMFDSIENGDLPHDLINCRYNGGMSREIANALFAKLADHGRVPAVYFEDIDLTTSTALILSPVLPKASTISVLPPRVSQKAYRILLDALDRAANSKLDNLALPILPRLHAQDGKGKLKRILVESALRCDAIHRLTFQLTEEAVDDDSDEELGNGSDDVVEIINEGAAEEEISTEFGRNQHCLELLSEAFDKSNGQSIEEFELRNVYLQDASALFQFLSRVFKSSITLGSLDLVNIRIENDDLDAWPCEVPDYCQVKEICLGDVKVGSSWVECLIRQVGNLPHLTRVHIIHNEDEECLIDNIGDITRSLVDLLQSKKIESLCMRNFLPHVTSISNALQGNTYLRCLSLDGLESDKKGAQELADVLEHSNVALDTVCPPCHFGSDNPFRRCGIAGDKIYYYSKLNRFGRAILQDSERASSSKLIDALQLVNGRDSNDVWTLAFLLGLLRLSPTLWSGGCQCARERLLQNQTTRPKGTRTEPKYPSATDNSFRCLANERTKRISKT